MEIWHNPRCSKSRAAKAALDAAGVEYAERRYLDDPPTEAELAAVLERLGLEPWEIARTGEPIARQVGLADLPRDAEHRGDWLSTLTAHPQLIQRPIVIADQHATLARDEAALAAITTWE